MEDKIKELSELRNSNIRMARYIAVSITVAIILIAISLKDMDKIWIFLGVVGILINIPNYNMYIKKEKLEMFIADLMEKYNNEEIDEIEYEEKLTKYKTELNKKK